MRMSCNFVTVSGERHGDIIDDKIPEGQTGRCRETGDIVYNSRVDDQTKTQ